MAQVNQLSEREKEVVRLVLQGKSNKQIAMTLGISSRTVEFHLKNVYAKLQVSSRIELILKLVNTTGGPLDEMLGKSTVEKLGENIENRNKHGSQMNWVSSFRNIVFFTVKEPEMKKRWITYFLTGLIFGAGYWHYFSITAMFFNKITVNIGLFNTVWELLLLPAALLIYFGIWLFPAILPAVYEFRCSTSLRFSVLAVVTVWVSAVLGYYVNYLAMLAIFGLPHMEYLLIFGQRTPTFWQDWAHIFPKLIFFKFLKWTVVSVFVGGIAGLITSSVYSSLSKKGYKILSV